MRLLDRLLQRYDGNHHAEIARRLSLQERLAARFEARLKRVEVELGIVRPDVVDDLERG